jgi:hypothetical protein
MRHVNNPNTYINSLNLLNFIKKAKLICISINGGFMKQIFSILVLSLMITSCEKIEGQLNVSTDVKLRNSDGVVTNLKVGTYSADIKANTSKKITLRLNNDNDEKYIFNIPDGSIPTNGNFNYKSDTVGQPVDLSGTVATATSDSARRQSTESCQYQAPVQVCYPTPNGGMACSVQYRTVYGTRFTTYFDRSTHKDVALSIAAANTTNEVAQFQGQMDWVERIVLNQSQCR